MKMHRSAQTVLTLLAGTAILLVAVSSDAQVRRPTATPARTPARVPGTVPGGALNPGAVTLSVLPKYAKPALSVFLPFDRETFNARNRTVPLDVSGGHPVYNSGAYMRRGRMRDALRFGPLGPMFLGLSPSPNTKSIEFTRFLTISAWVLPERLGGRTGSENATIMCRGASAGDNSVSYCLSLSPKGVPVFESRVAFNVKGAGPWTRQASRAVGSGGWHHVAVVFNRGAVSFFIDGRAAGQGRAPLRAMSPVRYGQMALYVGVRFADVPTNEYRDPYLGYLDDVALWGIALPAGEIALLARDADGNGIADYWDRLITGRAPIPANVKRTPRSGTTRRTPSSGSGRPGNRNYRAVPTRPPGYPPTRTPVVRAPETNRTRGGVRTVPPRQTPTQRKTPTPRPTPSKSGRTRRVVPPRR